MPETINGGVAIVIYDVNERLVEAELLRGFECQERQARAERHNVERDLGVHIEAGRLLAHFRRLCDA